MCRPSSKAIGVLFATVFRMASAIVAGVVFYMAIGEVREHVYPFVAWGVVFYIVTLLLGNVFCSTYR